MSLKDRLKAEIAASGPIPVAEYMVRCLHDGADGYYATRPALGGGGDFVTAPLVSQMFGELLGIWCVESWTRLGRPERFRLVEMGPGDGTLMSDLLRAVRLAPEFVAAADLWLVETSGPLKAAQAGKLAGSGAHWADSLDAVPGGAPLVLIANELFDCLPARQYVQTPGGWVERLVGLTPEGELTFGLAPSEHGAAPAEGAMILEVSPAQDALAGAIAARVVADGGAALIVDYGRDKPEFGDTLQALKGHEKVGALDFPGESDLTVHVDFPSLLTAAREAGAEATDPVPQGLFLGRLGIQHRAEALVAARPDRSMVIGRQLARLVAPDQMGELFKAVCIHQPGFVPPGFET
ncbi:MAG: class I SAM-dependent methyltransferase [Caulobacter sp.]|nr:class I SAM-dependent methyltransferase [Caulobacter sp.]